MTQHVQPKTLAGIDPIPVVRLANQIGSETRTGSVLSDVDMAMFHGVFPSHTFPHTCKTQEGSTNTLEVD